MSAHSKSRRKFQAPIKGRCRLRRPLTEWKVESGRDRQANIRRRCKKRMSSLKWRRNLRSQIDKAGNYVVPVNAVRTTEEIEKLARKIRGRLKM